MTLMKNSNNLLQKRIIVVNVNANLPGIGFADLQTAYDASFLKQCLVEYLVRSFDELSVKTDLLSIQKILHIRANKVPELMMKNSKGNNVYDFESNQRVDELIALLTINASINQMHKNRGDDLFLVSAWQRPNQGDAIGKFSGKESWDGFLHQSVPLGTEDISTNVFVMPVEIKSLMVNPKKEKYKNLNELLVKKCTKFSKHFQSEGSICAVVVLPFVMDPSQKELKFNLRKATETINENVSKDAIACLVFFTLENDEEGKTNIFTQCYFVSKNPRLGSNGNIENAELYRLKFGSFINIDQN